ncbi:MAG: tetratricopeptide repeat protein [Chloroflexota bacterium]
MAESADRFAQLLTEAIYQIRLREHKNISIVQDEVGYAIGRDGGSPIEYWRKGHIPKERTEIESLVKVMIERGEMDEAWLADFLDSAGYISPQPLINHYFPDLMETQVLGVAPSPRPSLRSKSTLPLAPTPFVGRRVEVDTVGELLTGQDCRMVTIVGPGGIGKTRLAAEIGQKLEKGQHFLDGVVYVSLASLESAADIPGAIASALNLQLSGSQNPRAQIIDYLQTQHLLLILDNFELLVDKGGELVADLLALAPRLSILITTRERLNLQWEQLFPLDGLGSRNRDEKSLGSDAADLFLGCVERANPGYQLTESDAIAINQICQMVAGFPLALELAASWASLLSITEIAAEISSGMDLLETSKVDMPERHRSLRAVCAYSVGALNPTDAEIFHKLSIFRGGFSRQAAAEVAGADLMTLGRLLDKSLVRLVDRNLYDLHQILLQYGYEMLSQKPEELKQVSQAHAEYYNQRLAEIAPDLGSFRHMELINDVGADLENVRQMWHWAIQNDRIDLIENAADGIMLYFHMSGRFEDGEKEFLLALDLLSSETITRIRLLNRLALMLIRQNKAAEAKQVLEESLTLSHKIDIDVEIPMANNFLSNIYSTTGEHEAAMALLEENLSYESNKANPVFESSTLNNMGTIYGRLGQYDDAQRVLEQSEKILRDMGQAWGLALFYQIHGEIAFHAGDYLGAERYFLVAIETYETLDFDMGKCQSMIQLAESLLKDHRAVEAGAEFLQSLSLANDLHAIQLMLRALIGIAQTPPTRHNGDLVYEIASLILIHPSAEDETKRAAEELLNGRPKFPYSHSNGEWLVDIVSRLHAE